MDYKIFTERYIRFWRHFHPNWQFTPSIQETIKGYCDLLTEEKISFNEFNEACTIVQKDLNELPSSWNLVAFVLDYVSCERKKKAEAQAVIDSRPIELPRTGKPIKLTESPKLQRAIEKIRKNNPALLAILEKINLHRSAQNPNICAACGNSGFIKFSAFGYGRDKKYKVYDPGDRPNYTFVKRCKCAKGNALAESINQATEQQCIEAAQINGQKWQVIEPF